MYCFNSTLPGISSTNEIESWGYCLPECPTAPPDPVCLDEPEFPALAGNDGSGAVNFTTTYEIGMAAVLYDVRGAFPLFIHHVTYFISSWQLDVVSFECPTGYVFSGSNNVTHYAICHNWGFKTLYDPEARCEREIFHY